MKCNEKGIEELRSSRKKEQMVFSDYIIIDDRIKANPDNEFFYSYRSYCPIENKNLPEKLSRLYTSDNSEILKFVKEYGLLGKNIFDESIAYIRSHIKSIHLCKQITELIKRSEFLPNSDYINPQLAEFLDHHRNIDKEDWFYTFEGIGIGEKILNVEIPYNNPENKEIYIDAIAIRQTILNGNLSSMHRVLDYDELGNEYDYFGFDTLLNAVYWMLTDTIRKGTIAECPRCHKLFVQSRTNQKYCSESCKNIFNVEKSKAKNKLS